MIDHIFENPEAFAHEYRATLEALVGKDFRDCSAQDQYQALAQLIGRKANREFATSDSENKKSDKKKIYYFCLEFLLGPLLDNYLLNYGVRDTVKQGLADMGIDLEQLIAQEGDPGLGNGGLGRLAACFLDSMAAEGILGFGNGMRYHYGLFKQKIVDGRQVEVTDNWLDKGYPWETKHPESSVLVRFGGEVVRHEDEQGHYWFTQEGGELVKAVPYDVPIVGYGGKTVNRLRLWSAEPAHEDFDLDAFNAGDYAKAAKFRTDAEAISEYPVSQRCRRARPHPAPQAGVPVRGRGACLHHPQLQVRPRRCRLGALPGLRGHPHQRHAPRHVRRRAHAPARGRGGPGLGRRVGHHHAHHLLHQPHGPSRGAREVAHRDVPPPAAAPVHVRGRDQPPLRRVLPARHRQLAGEACATPPSCGTARCAWPTSRSSAATASTAWLRCTPRSSSARRFMTSTSLRPRSSTTRRTAYRRAASWATPTRACPPLITSKIGNGWLADADELSKLSAYYDDAEFLDAMSASKRENKVRLARYVLEQTGVEIDPDSIFDVQVKRFHAYKRQLLNIFKVMSIYNRMLDDPSYKPHKTTFIISGKAASAYTFAKEVIRLINSVADVINNDERVNDYIKVAFIPNFAVSNAQLIYPAADISEQISTAGKEASGTSNMKLMMNGAITLGTLDGANVEIAELAGMENEKIFGLKVDQIEAMRARGDYFAWDVVNADPNGIGRCVRQLTDGTFAGLSGNFNQIYDELMGNNDYDLVIADFASYVQAWEELTASYDDQRSWQRRALHNIANSGHFSSDRTIREYATDIWGLN